jgi:uncharacterized protein YecE (DUF72 family)
MDFGKLPDISLVDFTLPPDASITAAALAALPKNDNPLHFYIGCTGWSMKEWVGSIYPAGTKAKDYLREYGKQFNTIELNTTHYRIPNTETIERWVAETPADFRFCPKVPQVISHSKNLGLDAPAFDQFIVAIAGLEAKLGPTFLQLPPYFDVVHFPILQSYVNRWPKKLPLTVELRHPSWFSESNIAQKEAYNFLAENGIGLVLTDVAGRRDVLHMRQTTPFAMIRFVGNALHPTDFQRIDEWVTRLQQWQALGLESVYLFTHEPDNLLAPELAKYLSEKLKDRPNIEVRGPNWGGGQQMLLF